jgi:hypothetical protein
MDKRLVILRTVLLVFLLGLQTPQFAQDTSTGPTQSDQERLRVAIGLVRNVKYYFTFPILRSLRRC